MAGKAPASSAILRWSDDAGHRPTLSPRRPRDVATDRQATAILSNFEAPRFETESSLSEVLIRLIGRGYRLIVVTIQSAENVSPL